MVQAAESMTVQSDEGGFNFLKPRHLKKNNIELIMTKEQATSTESNGETKKVEKTYLEKLKEKEAQLKARIQLIENKEKESLRKKENRVKFLLGAFMLDTFTKEKESFTELFDKFKTYLTRERDQEIVKSYFENKK